jgi:hypothetical protein
MNILARLLDFGRSIADVFGRTKLPEHTDVEAIESDWRAVGDSLRSVLPEEMGDAMPDRVRITKPVIVIELHAGQVLPVVGRTSTGRPKVIAPGCTIVTLSPDEWEPEPAPPDSPRSRPPIR